MSRRHWPAAVALLVVAAACSDRGTPPPTGPVEPPPVTDSPKQAELETTARRIALAMKDPAFRAYVKRQLDASPFREHKLQYQTFLAAGGEEELRQAFLRNGEAALVEVTPLAQSTEFYLPVPEHRRQWTGDARILVATALHDHDAPIAFDLEGRRHVLDPDRPPATPVLALVPQETDFTGAPAAKCLDPECTQPWGGGGGTGGGGGGGGGGDPTFVAGDLTLTYASFVDDFEGWLKGNPEYELHIMGPVTAQDTTTLSSFQCIGEHAPTGYAWDMNGQTWSGQATLYTSQQMDAFAQTFPGRAYLIFALEDDDTACEIKTDGPGVSDLLQALGQAYADYKAAKDQKVFDPQGAYRILQAAKSGANVISIAASLIKTRDEAIGFAVKNDIAGRYNPNANWVVLDAGLNAQGWLNLVMQ